MLWRHELGVLGVAVCALTLAACDDFVVETVVDSALEDMEAESVIFGLTSHLTRDGIREATVMADTAYFFRDSTIVHLRGHVRLTAFHEELGTEKALVTSDRGRLNTTTNALIARGNAVLLIRADGRRIESVELNYAPDQNKIWSDSATVMYQKGRILEGSGFDADLDFDRVEVRNGRSRGGVIGR